MKDTFTLLQERKKNQRLPYYQDFLPLVYSKKIKVANHTLLIEKVLMSKLKVGDHSAFSSIFTAYYPDLVMFSTRFTHDLNDAEEIVQDTFLSLWEEHESIKINTSLKSYLLKVVQNKCIDWYRHKKIVRTYNNALIEGEPQFISDTDRYILFSELQEQIEAALNKLPEEISEVFRMNRNKGLKYHEIADRLDVSVRTIEVRIGKALHMLHNQLKGYLL